MICIHCQHEQTDVFNSRTSKKDASVWRRRRCRSCEHEFTTYERPAQHESSLVTPKSGPALPFSLPRLFLSIHRELDNTPDQPDIAFALATTCQQRLLQHGTTGLTPHDIAKVAHETITAFAPAAGARYGLRHGITTPGARQRRSKVTRI